jgi:hypothetical protein
VTPGRARAGSRGELRPWRRFRDRAGAGWGTCWSSISRRKRNVVSEDAAGAKDPYSICRRRPHRIARHVRRPRPTAQGQRRAAAARRRAVPRQGVHPDDVFELGGASRKNLLLVGVEFDAVQRLVSNEKNARLVRAPLVDRRDLRAPRCTFSAEPAPKYCHGHLVSRQASLTPWMVHTM